MELFEENKNEYNEKKSTDKNLITYNSDAHIINILKEILYDSTDNKDCLEEFEELSKKMKMKVKKHPFQYHLPKEITSYKPELSKYEEQCFKANIKKKPKELNKHSSFVDDIIYQSKLLEWAGISFNNLEWYKLKTAIDKLLLETKAINIRFWGKIYGIESDYYILQGTLSKYSDFSYLPNNVEKPGIEGLNRYTFWYSDATLDSWFEFPEVSSEQLKASRLFKYQFTGDPNSEVFGFNNFPWPEIYLLKCQILRILHGASIAPVDSQKMGKGEGDFEEKITEYNEEYVIPQFEEMNNPEKWMHENANILLAGSIIHAKPVSEETLEKDKYIPRMQPIAVDEPFGENNPSWNFRIVGDNQIYSQAGGKEGTTNYAAIVIRSLRWPGSTCVYKNNEYVNIYIGNGVKYGGSVFIPTEPDEVENDPEGIDEFPEPNPDKEPIIIESDTDDEKNPEDEMDA